MYPDQGAAALGRGLPPDAPGQGVRAEGGGGRLRPRRGGQAVAQGLGAAGLRHRPPDEEEQDRGRVRGGQARRQGQGLGQDRQGRAGAERQGHHPRHRRPGPRTAGAGARRRPGLELQGRAEPAPDAQETAGHRVRRHRDRIRELFQHARGRNHGRRGDGAHSSRRG